MTHQRPPLPRLPTQTNDFNRSLEGSLFLRLHQIREIAEFFGFESRNKYEILNSENQRVGFAAEQQKGFLDTILRQFLGHWRPFEIHFFNTERALQFRAIHPFRFYFQRLDIVDASEKTLGAIEQRFSIMSRKFDILDNNGMVLLRINSPFWKFWTFPAYQGDNTIVATIMKKWSGAFSEMFSDRDNFIIEFQSPRLGPKERQLLLAASVFVDLQYFERKANK